MVCALNHISHAFTVRQGYKDSSHGRKGENDIHSSLKEGHQHSNNSPYSVLGPVTPERISTISSNPNNQEITKKNDDTLIFPDSSTNSTKARADIADRNVFEAPKKDCPPGTTLDDLGNCRKPA